MKGQTKDTHIIKGHVIGQGPNKGGAGGAIAGI